MDQKNALISALSVGVGVGVGLGLVSGSTLGRWTGASDSAPEVITSEQIKMELLRLTVDGKDINVTFEDFPYCLSDQTRVKLTNAAYVHLNYLDVAKYTRNLPTASRAVLISGPAEAYNQMLAKALAHHCKAKLLLLDFTDFSIKMQNKYGTVKKNPSQDKSISDVALERVSSFLGSFSLLSSAEADKGSSSTQTSGSHTRTRTSSAASVKNSTNAPLMCFKNWSFDEKIFFQSLFKVLVSVAETDSIILYIRDVDKVFLQSSRLYNLFDKVLKKLSGPILVIGSRILDRDEATGELDRLSLLFPYNIEIKPPEDEFHLIKWTVLLNEDMESLSLRDSKNHIAEVLTSNDLECDDLGVISNSDILAISNDIEEIVIPAIIYHLTNTKEPKYRNKKLVISSKSLCHGLSIFKDGKSSEDTLKGSEASGEKSVSSTKADGEKSSKPEVPPDNEFERRMRAGVILCEEIGVTFADIGALDEVKESLQELVMLPIRRPDLFKGGLLKPCRGILLFGPPGTGKTMLAKAIAREAGASFMNVSMSLITSKWFGEDEKNIRAIFTLAAKVSPTVIFIDEVDSLLGQRTSSGEHEVLRRIKNEFMTHWDGLLTKSTDRILVLAATNRPFDLDEAIIRRFERRIMIDLPSVDSREKILRTLLSKEKVDDDIDYKELATITDGYSGSDLKTLCTTAAYRPVRELIKQERLKDEEKKKTDETKSKDISDPKEEPKKESKGEPKKESKEESKKESKEESKKEPKEESKKEPKEESKEESNQESKEESKQEIVISLRPVNMEDMRQAKNQVSSSFASQGFVMNELKQWNELYGEGGTRKQQQLSYFL